MPTLRTVTSRIAVWLLHAMFVTWLFAGLACGAKSGGDTSLLPGKLPQDAGGGTTHDAKSDAKVVDAAAKPPADTGTPIGSDAQPPAMDAAPKPTVVSISVSPATTNVPPAGKVTLKVTGTNSDTTTTDVTVGTQFTSSNTSIATVNGSVVNALTPGNVTIIASYNGLIAFSNITVGQATVLSLSLSPSPVSVYSGSSSSSPITAQALMSDGSRKDVTSQVAWTSSDSTIAPVSATGYVQGLNPGSAKITATLGQIQATVSVQVYGQSLKRVTVRANPSIARPGDFIMIDVLAYFENGFSYSITPSTTLESSNAGVLKLSSNGNGIATSPGKTVVTAKLGDQTVGSVEVVVTTATLLRLELNPTKLSFDYPNTGHFSAMAVYDDMSRYDVTLLAQCYPSEGNSFNVQPDNSLQPYALGKSTITCSYENFSATTEATVTMGSPTSLDIGTDPVSVPNFGTFFQYATLLYADGNQLDATSAVTWVSDDPAIATPILLPDYAGTFLVGHAGSTKIRAKLGNLTSGDVSVKILDVALLAIDLSDSHLFLSIGSTENVSANGTFQDGSQADLTMSVTWKTGNPAIATVSNDPASMGLVTGVSTGTTSLTATLNGVSTTTTITVN